MIIAAFALLVNLTIFTFYAILAPVSQYISVDIGGTQLRAALYPAQGLRPIKVMRTATCPPASPPSETVFERLRRLIETIWPTDEVVEAISVAAPGPIDPEAGVIFEAPNIPGWFDVPLKRLLEEAFPAPVLLGNDANLAAVGEWKYGSGRGHHHLIYLTISTGIGGGVIVNDQLLLGARGLAGELGHVTVMSDGPLCACGQRGHLEAVAAGPAIARWVQEQVQQGAATSVAAEDHLTARHIAAAALQGDPLCLAALERAGRFIGQALADYTHIFNPSVIVIGGGVSQAGDLLFNPMRTSLQEHSISPAYLHDLTLTSAHFGDEAGLIGALALARERYSPEDSI